MKAFVYPSLLLLLVGVISSMGQGIRVESAHYGTRDRSGVDVTRRVQQFADFGEPFRVSNDTFRIDPAPNDQKTLVVTYYVNGHRISERVQEGEVFYFRAGSYTDSGPGYYKPGVQIIRAVYGIKGRYVEVTGMVRDLVRNGRPFTVSNDTFGVNPYQGREKHLKIFYIRDGERREKEYEEGASVRF